MSKIGSKPSTPTVQAAVTTAQTSANAVETPEVKPLTLGQQIQQNQFQTQAPTITPQPSPSTSQQTVSADPSLKRSLRSFLAAAQAAGGSQLVKANEPPTIPMPSLPTSMQSSPQSTGLSGGTGALGLNDPNVAPARAHAQEIEGQRIRWNNPAGILNNLSQIDSNSGEQRGGNDAVRCGAASLVAGGVLTGPESFKEGLGRLHERGSSLLTRLENMQGIEQIDGSQASLNDVPASQRDGIRNTLSTPLRSALSTVNELQQRDPSTLTNGDLQQLQEATYQIAVLDQRTNAQGNYSMALEAGQNMPTTQTGIQQAMQGGNAPNRDDFLTTGTLQTYRDLMWGSERPQMNGRNLDLNWVSNDNDGGHFVLADQNGGNAGRSVAYNPWPEQDGTAYSRGVDGAGINIRSMGEDPNSDYLRGMDIDDSASQAVRLPAR